MQCSLPSSTIATCLSITYLKRVIYPNLSLMTLLNDIRVSFKCSLPDDAQVTDDSSRSQAVLYFHGNAASRAAPNRIRIARAVSQLDANFIIIDYR